MNAAQYFRFFHALAGFGDLIHTHVVVDGGVFREPPAAEVADDFADDAGVALRNESRLFGLQFDNHRRGGVKRQLFVERTQIRALGNEHFVPFLSRCPGI